jgi:hypothetical protein
VNKIGVTSVTVILPLQFGQVSIVGTMECASLVLMMFPFILNLIANTPATISGTRSL